MSDRSDLQNFKTDESLILLFLKTITDSAHLHVRCTGKLLNTYTLLITDSPEAELLPK